MSEDKELLGGIFAEDEVAENMRESAKALGLNPDLVASDEENLKYVARKSCKMCFGRGILEICLSPSKPKIFHRNKSNMGERSLNRGASRPRRKTIFGVSPGNELHLEWDDREEVKKRDRSGVKRLLGKLPDHSYCTSRPEPAGYKERNTTQAFCRCVRAVPA